MSNSKNTKDLSIQNNTPSQPKIFEEDDYEDNDEGKEGEEWTAATTQLGNLSTPILISTLSSLRSKSATLSSTLTAKLASSPSGQNLLHIGPSLSTLPPDLHSLITNLEPVLEQIQQYRDGNIAELERVVNLGRNIELALRRAEDGKECAELLGDLCSVEVCVERDSSRRSMGSSSPNKSGDDEKKRSLFVEDDSALLEELDDLDHVASLERAAHTTLHLVQQLKSSSAQVTSTLSVPNNNNNSNKSKNETSSIKHEQHKLSNLSSMETPLPQDTEKSYFIMKLAPRIRKLEMDTLKALVANLEKVLVDRMTRRKNRDASTSNDRSTETKNEFMGVNGNNNKNTLENNGIGLTINGSVENDTGAEQEAEIKQQKKELLILGHLLRALALLGRGSEAEATFARVAIMPIIRNKVSMGRLDEGGPRGECAGLFGLLEEIVYAVMEMWGDVLKYVEGMFELGDWNNRVDKGSLTVSTEVDMVTAGVWVPIATALMADPAIKMAIFSPGIATILQANYTALDTFLSELASNLLKPSPTNDIDHDKSKNSNILYLDGDTDAAFSQLYFQPKITPQIIQSAQTRIYSHSMTAEFTKKWNLPIYYQLRFAEVCNRMNKAISRVQTEGWLAEVFSGPDSVATELREKAGFELSLFLELYDALVWLWKPEVLLRPLTHRFLRGAMQLLGRVIVFVKDGLDGKIKFGADEPQSGDSLKSNGIENDSLGVNGGKLVMQEGYCWGKRIEDVAAVAWELTVLETYINHDYHTIIMEAVAPADATSRGTINNTEDELKELRLICGEVLDEASQEISPIISRAWNEIIVSILTAKCSGPLSAVKGVAATYRMTNRPPPTQASPFVGTILRPLKEFDDVFSSRTPPQVGSKWKEEVVAIIAGKYSAAVSELIETVQRTEEALKNRKARRAAAGGMSDGEKVKLQLFLDQRQFAKNVDEVGVNSSSVEGVRELISLTNSAEVLYLKNQSGGR